jgi:polar amino acid transport system permease protein
MKGSALVSTITVMDLMGQTRTVFARSYDLGIYLWAALLYLALAAMLTWLHRLLGGRICASGK